MVSELKSDRGQGTRTDSSLDLVAVELNVLVEEDGGQVVGELEPEVPGRGAGRQGAALEGIERLDVLEVHSRVSIHVGVRIYERLNHEVESEKETNCSRSPAGSCSQCNSSRSLST